MNGLVGFKKDPLTLQRRRSPIADNLSSLPTDEGFAIIANFRLRILGGGTDRDRESEDTGISPFPTIYLQVLTHIGRYIQCNGNM